MKILAADIGGTRVKTGLVEDGIILSSRIEEIDVKDSFRVIMDKLSLAFIEHLQEINSGISDSVSAIGLALPGIVDSRRNRMLDINEKLEDSLEFNFNSWAKENWNLPLFIENDARAALLGSWKYGSGRNCDNLVMLTLGTGIGTAALLEGKILRGKHFQAGNLGGHFTVSLDGPVCNCGNRGCAEALGSTWMLKVGSGQGHKDNPNADFRQLFERYRESDPSASERVKGILAAWAACTVNMVHAFDPEKIIYSGGVMRSADIILPFLRDWIDQHAWMKSGRVELIAEKRPEEIALLGMAYLAMQSHKK